MRFFIREFSRLIITAIDRIVLLRQISPRPCHPVILLANLPDQVLDMLRFVERIVPEEPEFRNFPEVKFAGEDLAKKHPEITAQLRSLLRKWQAETGAFIPQPITADPAARKPAI